MSNQNEELIRLYGSGWRFPLRFEPRPVTDATDGLAPSAVVMSAGGDNVAQSLAMLFQTQPGERIMRPDYGCDMQSLMFANLSESMLGALRHRIVESVARHEPRAEQVDVVLQEDPSLRGLLHVAVRYHLAGQTQQVTGQLNLLESEGGGSAWAIS